MNGESRMDKQPEDFNYTVGIYDVICRYIRKKVEDEAGKKGTYGIGVYTDRFCEEELIIYRNYLQSFRTCIKLLIDKNKQLC